MSTERTATKPNGDAAPPLAIDPMLGTGPASKAVSLLEDRALRGATSLSRLAYRTADQLDSAAEYVQKTGVRALDAARGLRQSASQHVLPVALGAAAAGFGVCYLMMRKRRGAS